MISPAGPPNEETTRIGSETIPRANGHRRLHQRARQSAAPQIASTTRSPPPSPCWALLTSDTVPRPTASAKSALSTSQSRRERWPGGVSSSGPRSSAKRWRSAFISASLGAGTPADQPTKVGRQTDFRRSTVALRPMVGGPLSANPVLSARSRPLRIGDPHAYPPRAPDLPTPLAGDRPLAHPHDLRRFRRRKGVDALVPEPLRPR